MILSKIMEAKKVIEILIKRLVSEPDQVEINESQGERSLVFKARVAKKDMGKIIGKKGKTVEAIKTIINAFGVKQNKYYKFHLIEDE